MKEIKITTNTPLRFSRSRNADFHAALGVNEPIRRRTGIRIKIAGWNDEQSACFFKVSIQRSVQ